MTVTNEEILATLKKEIAGLTHTYTEGKFEDKKETCLNAISTFLESLSMEKVLLPIVICDNTNNSPESIDRGFLIIDIFLPYSPELETRLDRYERETGLHIERTLLNPH